ncbi:GntR family transcriptional regulator [Haloferula helveola]|uniref:GntR family transcriptional regulator n=1 Tax=Haloferula helveola TaxID=490095 RepID=A0ABM7RKS7_9BACT|nr:GntR family transcriptional regulator [Haloferula helveola]
MAELGEWAALKVIREKPPGLYLDSEGEEGEVLLPRKEMPASWELGGTIEVFLYTDSEDRIIATPKRPRVMPGEFGYLKVVAETRVGSFLDWGLQKDLLLPFGEQRERVPVGRSCVVHVHVDPESGRIVASRRLGRHLSQDRPRYQPGQEVELLLYGKTEMGYKAIVDGKFGGVLFANEVFRDLRAGERTQGYIKEVRDDGKIDLSLYPPGRKRVNDLESRIEDELHRRGGFWELCDSSPAEVIHQELGVSKKAFKQATGALFRKRKIVISDDGIRLTDGQAPPRG